MRPMNDLTASFLETRFEFPEKPPGPTFWVITAWNPDGKIVSVEANQKADAELAAELDRDGLPRVRAYGGSPDWSHVEPGWAVVCSEVHALRLGKRFRQLAVFAFDGSTIQLVDCQSCSRTELAHRTDRLRRQFPSIG